MKPVRLDLEMWSDCAFDERLEVTLDGAPQDFSGWEFEAIAALSPTSAQKLFDLTVTPREPGTLGLHVEVETLRALFPSGSSETKKTVVWVLKARPAASYMVRLFYGTILIRRGLPS